MTNEQTPANLSKTCTNCGQQKPLSAFLEMTEDQGTIYGSICSTCRKTVLMTEENRRKTDAEGSTTSESGHSINAKTKLHSDIDKREQAERTEKEYHAERDINEVKHEEKIAYKNELEHEHRKHREDFLKQRSFIGSDKKPAKPQNPEAQVTAQGNQQAAVKSSISKENRKNTEHDFQFANQGQQISGQIRFTGVSFQAFRDYLGSAGNLVSNKDQTTKVKEAAKSKNPAVEYIENNWRPGGGKKR